MSIIILPHLLENLEYLKTGEDKIRTDSSLSINSNATLSEHIKFIHECMDMLMWMHNRTIGLDLNDNSIAIAGLQIRLFNSIASCIKLLLSGYYQGSVSFIRDVLEVSFLLDYFTLDDSSIERWIKKPSSNEFKPIEIRKKLDERDDLSEQKRKDRYKLFSAYGTHATFDGNRLFNNNNLLTIGPFFNQKFLENILFDLAEQLAHPILSFMKFESNLSIEDFKSKRDFFAAMQYWWKVNKDIDLSRNKLEELNDLFDLLEKT